MTDFLPNITPGGAAAGTSFADLWYAATKDPYAGLERSPRGYWAPTPSGRIDEIVWAGADINTAGRSVSDTQATISADGAVLRLLYGRVRVGAQIAALLPYQGDIIALCVWGEGPIDAIEEFELGNQPLPSGQQVTHYLGTAEQSVDATLSAAFAAQSPAVIYADALAGVAYSVLHVAAGATSFDVAATLRGLKPFDPRTSGYGWTQNPALVLADVLSNTIYGACRTMDWASVTAAANACDEVVGATAEPRRQVGLSIDAAQDIDSWLAALATYAGVFVVDDGVVVRLVPDRPAAPVAAFDHASGNIAKIGVLKKRGLSGVPTVMEVRYTDTSTAPWREALVSVSLNGVAQGTVPRRESSIALPGIQRYSQAMREAIERLNKLTLGDLSFPLESFDEAAAVQVGDVVSVTHPVGLSAKQVRVMGKNHAYGQHTLECVEYDPGVYDDSVLSAPTLPDTALPDPGAIPAPSGLSATEEVYQLDNGLYASRMAAAWSAVVWPWLDHYRIELRYGDALITTADTVALQYRSPPLQEAITYTLRVWSVAQSGIASPVSEVLLLVQGSQLPPPSVTTWITALEAGGRVFLAWAPVGDIDKVRYDLRYGPTAGTFATATRIDILDGISKVVEQLPSGTWRFYVTAVDSVGNYAATPLTADIAVTQDPQSFSVSPHVFSAPTLTNMAAATYMGGQSWVTDFGDGWGYGHSDTNNATGTFADLAGTPFCDPHTAGTSRWQSESYDMCGTQVSGEWTVSPRLTNISGTASVYVDLSPDNTNWTAYQGTRIKGAGRYVRVRIETTGSMRIQSGVSVALAVVPRRESGTVATSASGATTVSLTGKYAYRKSITLTVQGTAARIAVWNNVLLSQSVANTFEVRAFTTANAQSAETVDYVFEGI